MWHSASYSYRRDLGITQGSTAVWVAVIYGMYHGIRSWNWISRAAVLALAQAGAYRSGTRIREVWTSLMCAENPTFNGMQQVLHMYNRHIYTHSLLPATFRSVPLTIAEATEKLKQQSWYNRAARCSVSALVYAPLSTVTADTIDKRFPTVSFGL